MTPETGWTIAGGALTALVAAGAWLTLRSAAAVRALSDVLAESEARAKNAATRGAKLPRLSIVVTACNEERDVAACVERFLAQDDVDLELIVVDDRSTDRTPEILDALVDRRDASGRLVVIHNRELPEGRLGKCNACAVGAARASGEWILFADGDVTLVERNVLARVVAFAERERFDHVAVFPDLRPQTFFQEATVNIFGSLYFQGVRVWEMERDLPRGGGGVGAFNLMRRTSYDRVGGHDLLMMDTADDFKLGRLLKESGARQRMFHGTDLILCPWQRGLVPLIRGIEKNSFGGFDYSLVLLSLVSAAIALVLLGPFVLPVLGVLGGAFDSKVAALAVFAPLTIQYASVVAQLALYGRRSGARVAPALVYPLGVVFFLFAIWRSAVLILFHGGVRWRGSFYPLAALRSGLVRSGAGRRAS